MQGGARALDHSLAAQVTATIIVTVTVTQRPAAVLSYSNREWPKQNSRPKAWSGFAPVEYALPGARAQGRPFPEE